MRAEATVVLNWWPEPKWGRCRVQWWRRIGADGRHYMGRIGMGGPRLAALDLGDSVVREAAADIDRYMSGALDVLDSGWKETRFRDGHRRYVRTLTYTTPTA